MSYIGNTPAEKYSSFTKQDFSTSATTSYTLSQSVANENEIALFINFVRQEPTTAYTASGTTLTLTSATSSSDDMYCVYLGKAVQTVNPPTNSVGASQLASDAVTAAKLNDDIISGQTALASEPADTDEFLVSDAGTLKRIDYSLIKGGGVTEVDQWRLSSSFDGNANPIASNLERVDTAPQGYLGTGMSQSSGIFTFPSTGHWFVKFNINYFGNSDGDIRQAGGTIDATTNNSSYVQLAEGFNGCNNHGANYSMCTEISTILDITDTANQKVRFQVYTTTTGATCSGDSSNNRTFMTFIKLADT